MRGGREEERNVRGGERGCEEERGSEGSEGVRRGEQTLEEGDRGAWLLF